MKKEWRTIKKNKTLGAFEVSQEVGPGRSAQAGQIQAQSEAVQEAGPDSERKVWLQVKRGLESQTWGKTRGWTSESGRRQSNGSFGPETLRFLKSLTSLFCQTS